MKNSRALLVLVIAVILIAVVSVTVPAPKNDEMEGTYYMTESYTGYYEGAQPCITEEKHSISERYAELHVKLVKDNMVSGTYKGRAFTGTFDYDGVATFAFSDDLVGGVGTVYKMIRDSQYIYMTACTMNADGSYSAMTAAFFPTDSKGFVFTPPKVEVEGSMTATSAYSDVSGIITVLDENDYSMWITLQSHGIMFSEIRSSSGTDYCVGTVIDPYNVESITVSSFGMVCRITSYVNEYGITNNSLGYVEGLGTVDYVLKFRETAESKAVIPNLKRVNYIGTLEYVIGNDDARYVIDFKLAVDSQFNELLLFTTYYGSEVGEWGGTITKLSKGYALDIIAEFNLEGNVYHGLFKGYITEDQNYCDIWGLSQSTSGGTMVTSYSDLERTEKSKDLTDIVGKYNLYGASYGGYESGVRYLMNYSNDVDDCPLTIYSIVNGVLYGDYGGTEFVGTYDTAIKFILNIDGAIMRFQGLFNAGIMNLACISYDLDTEDYCAYYFVYVKEGVIPDGTLKPATGLGGFDYISPGETWYSYDVYTYYNGAGSRVDELFTMKVSLQGPGISFMEVYNTVTKVTRNCICVNITEGSAKALCINKGSVEIYTVSVYEKMITAGSTKEDDPMKGLATTIHFSDNGAKQVDPIIPDFEGKVYTGTDFYVVHDTTYSVAIRLTLSGQFECNVTAKTEFGVNTSQWSMLLNPMNGKTLVAAAFFTIAGEQFIGEYVGQFSNDLKYLTVTGVAINSNGDSLALSMELALSE